MLGSLPLVYWYVSLHGVSVLILTITSYVVYAQTDAHHRSAFVAYLLFGCCWLAAAVAQLFAGSPEVTSALSLAADAFGLFSVAAIGYFATVYTDRSTSLRKPQNAAWLAWVVLGTAGIVTQPLLGLQYESTTYREEPFAYLAIEPGPAYLLSVAVTMVVLAVSIGYLARLFVESHHRPSSSVVVLVGATVLSLVPNALSTQTVVPVLPGYDYTVLGIVPLGVVLAYVVFFRGELDLAPMARNEVVDEIDDALFGLDDAERIIDYNAAARAVLPPDTGDPVGMPLTALLSELEPYLRNPDGTDDALATYTTVTDGTRTHYSVSVSTISERGVVAGYTVILRDVTASETARRELRRQNDQLESFASTVAHDLRNPLQVADGTTTLLAERLRSGGETTPAADHLDRVDEAVSRMDAVLGELQTLAEHAQSVTETESVAFAETVRDCWRTATAGEMTLIVPADGTIEAEPNRLENILESLFRRSADGGGATVRVGLTAGGFTYTDDGLDIPTDRGRAVFAYDPMTGVDEVGLGLKIVRTQAESQGWTVTAEPSDGGTTFVVSGAETTLSENATEVWS